MEWLENAGKIFGLLASLGVLGGIALVVRTWWNAHRWSVFVSLVERWADEEYQRFQLDLHAPLRDEVLKPLVANWLYESQFSAKESKELLEYGVLFARARVLQVIQRIERER